MRDVQGPGIEHLHHLLVIAGLRPEQRCFQCAWVTYSGRAPVALDQGRVHCEHVGYREVVARHGLFRQLTVKAVELLETRCERCHHVAARVFTSLPVGVVAQGFVQYRLELAALGFVLPIAAIFSVKAVRLLPSRVSCAMQFDRRGPWSQNSFIAPSRSAVCAVSAASVHLISSALLVRISRARRVSSSAPSHLVASTCACSE